MPWPIEWQCGMCNHWSPNRNTKRCAKCGAVRGMGWRGGKTNTPTRARKDWKR